MSQRPGLLVEHRIRAKDGGWPETRSPNQQPDVINAEIRCHWPYLAPRERIIEALTLAYNKAVYEVLTRYPMEGDE